MAIFSIAGSEEDLAGPDDLWALLTELLGQGFRGLVSAGPDGVGGQVFSLEAHIDDPDAPDGTRTIRGTIGDKKVTIGSVVSVMTQAAYDAAYGGGS